MHASIEQLLTLRDGAPVDAAVTRHISDCGQCGEQLAGLGAVQQSLRKLPQTPAPSDGWQRLEAHLDKPATKTAWKAVAAAAAVVAAVLVAFLMPAQAPAPAPFAEQVFPADPGSDVVRVAEANIGDLVLQSRRLEQLLRELDEPRVMNAGTAGTIAGLQEGIAVIDYGLSTQAQLSPGQSQQLWRQRVGLMNSLVQVRGAQLQQISN